MPQAGALALRADDPRGLVGGVGRQASQQQIPLGRDHCVALGALAKLARTQAPRLELGVLALGADPGEQLEARAVVTAALYGLAPAGRRRLLWQRDDAAHPLEVSAHGEWVRPSGSEGLR